MKGRGLPHGWRWAALLSSAPLAVGMLAIQSGGGVTVDAFNPNKAPAIQDRLLDSAADIALGYGSLTSVSPRLGHLAVSDPPPDYTPAKNGECPVNYGDDVKVNQSCLNVSSVDQQGRGQAQNETAIAVDPENPDLLIAASNDYTLGDGLEGGVAFSTDGGRTWQNSQVPLEYTRGSDFSGDSTARMYWQGGGDPSLAWDTQGNAYFAGLHFNRGASVSDNPDASSAVYLYRSTGNDGASWSFPGTPVVTSFDPTTSASGLPLIDKPYMTIDDHTSADAYTNRIYVTWTDFAADGTAYLYEAHSSDYGRSFSAPALVSHNSDSLCPNNYATAGVVPENGNNCDENQFSDPFVGPDGTLYVVYDNYNNATTTANDNYNNVLIAKSTDGGASFDAPVQVAEYNDLPDCATYQDGQDAFRACVPEKGSQQDSVFRAANYPSGGVSPEGTVAVTFGSYISQFSNPANGCVPTGFASDGANTFTGVKTAGACSNKILESVSTDAGASFTGTGKDPSDDTVVSQGGDQEHTDQWFQWSSFNRDGSLAVSYYDRQYGTDETTGTMDVTLSTSDNLSSFTARRATSGSMPLPTQFPDSQGNSLFFGDYTGLAYSNRQANPLWSDTRDVDLFDCGTNPPAVCTATEPDGLVATDETIFTISLRR